MYFQGFNDCPDISIDFSVSKRIIIAIVIDYRPTFHREAYHSFETAYEFSCNKIILMEFLGKGVRDFFGVIMPLALNGGSFHKF